jgi:hypothetical protein
MAPASKSPDIPHRTCVAAGMLSSAVLFLGCLTLQWDGIIAPFPEKTASRSL